jgi:hypothetical protein
MAGSSVLATADQFYFNCFPNVARHPITGETDFSVIKRSGIQQTGLNVGTSVGASAFTIPLANLGMTQLSDVCVGAWYEDTTQTIKVVQYRPTAGTQTLIGAFSGATPSDLVYITEIMLTTSFTPGIVLHWCKGDYSTSKGYYAQSSGGVFTGASLTQIVDVDYPANLAGEVLVGPMQQLNGYFYAMGRSGNIYQCDNVYNVVAWGSRILNTYAYPDKGVGIVRYKHHLVAFSDTTIEFFNDSGARGDGSTISSSLERTEQAFIKFGAPSAKFIKNVDDILYWISSSDTATTGVWKLDGYTPVKISTLREDQIVNSSIERNGALGEVAGSLECMTLLGQKHIIINGMQTEIVPFTQDTSFSDFTPGDDCYYEAVVDQQSRYNANILCYSLNTQTWWSFSDCSDCIDVKGILPTPYFNRTSSLNYQDEMVLKYPGQSAITSLWGKYIAQIQSDNIIPVDDATNLVYNPKYSVVAYIQTNTTDQDTNKIKIIRRATIVQNAELGFETNTYEAPYIYLAMMRDDFTGAYKTITTPQSPLTGNPSFRIFPIKRQNNWYPLGINNPTFEYQALASTASITNKMVLEGWFDYPNSGPNHTYPVANWKSDNTSSSFYLDIESLSPNVVTVTFNVANAQSEAIGLHSATWTLPWNSTDSHHLAIEFDGTTAQKVFLYMDGVLQSTTTNNVTATTIQVSSAGLRVGRMQANPLTQWPYPNMAVLRLWNITRSASDIKYYMTNDLINPSNTPGLIWAMQSGTDRRIYENQTPANTVVPTAGMNTTIAFPRPIFSKRYVNNCGQVQRTQWGILEKSPYQFQVKYLELDVMQGQR